MDSQFEKEPESASCAHETFPTAQRLKHSSWLLVELERLLNELPAEIRQACLQEVEEHLACCRLALEEVGVNPPESDREAVQRFGSPEAFATEAINSRNRARSTSKFMVGVTTASVLVALAWLVLGIFNMALVWPLVVVSVTAFTLCSWNHRLQLKSVVKGGFLATLFLSIYIGFAYVNLREFGGLGMTARWLVPGIKADSEGTIALTNQALSQCDPIQKAFRTGEAAVQQTPFYSRGAYLAFEGPSMPAPYQPPLYKIVKLSDFRRAADSWQNYRQNFRANWSRNAEDAIADSAAADHSGDSTFSLVMASQGAQAGLLLTLISFCLNFAVFAFRLFWERLRAPRKRLVA